MAFQKDFETPSTGAVANYHVVQQVSLDRQSQITNATVASYLSKDAYLDAKFPMYTQQIQIDGLPASGEDVFDSAEQRLVAPEQDGAPPATNRYVFAGAVILPADASTTPGTSSVGATQTST